MQRRGSPPLAAGAWVAGGPRPTAPLPLPPSLPPPVLGTVPGAYGNPSAVVEPTAEGAAQSMPEASVASCSSQAAVNAAPSTAIGTPTAGHRVALSVSYILQIERRERGAQSYFWGGACSGHIGVTANGNSKPRGELLQEGTCVRCVGMSVVACLCSRVRLAGGKVQGQGAGARCRGKVQGVAWHDGVTQISQPERDTDRHGGVEIKLTSSHRQGHAVGGPGEDFRKRIADSTNVRQSNFFCAFCAAAEDACVSNHNVGCVKCGGLVKLLYLCMLPNDHTRQGKVGRHVRTNQFTKQRWALGRQTSAG